MAAAYYILAREDPGAVDPQWMNHVGRLLDWVKFRFGRGPFFGGVFRDRSGHRGFHRVAASLRRA